MSDQQRQAILDNVRYLRNVRPIDPEEIREYVSTRPQSTVVKQVIREEAFDLGLRERPDGTFHPIREHPLDAEVGHIERFPESYARVLEDALVAEFGAGWPTGESGDRLRERIRAIKESYLQGDTFEYDWITALAYAVYHLPDYYAVGQYAVSPLLANDLLPARPRVLDVGAGVGGPALGLLDLVCDGGGIVDYHAVEPGEAADLLETFLEETGPNAHTTIHRERAETFEPEGEFDLIVFANVLAELEEPSAVIRKYADALAPDGAILAISPADRETATGLRQIERSVEDRLTIYAPTVRLWRDEQPDGECWSFDRKQDLSVPPFQARLDEASDDTDHDPGEFCNVDVQYAYSILRRDDRRVIEYTPSDSRVSKMADADDYVTDRVDVVGIKLSPDLRTGPDSNSLFLVGDGSERIDHFAVLARESGLNQDLRESDYGDLLSFQNALALWNDDEEAYNLVVDGETVVDRVPVP